MEGREPRRERSFFLRKTDCCAPSRSASGGRGRGPRGGWGFGRQAGRRAAPLRGLSFSSHVRLGTRAGPPCLLSGRNKSASHGSRCAPARLAAPDPAVSAAGAVVTGKGLRPFLRSCVSVRCPGSHRERSLSGASLGHFPVALQEPKVTCLPPAGVSQCAGQGRCCRAAAEKRIAPGVPVRVWAPRAHTSTARHRPPAALGQWPRQLPLPTPTPGSGPSWEGVDVCAGLQEGSRAVYTWVRLGDGMPGRAREVVDGLEGLPSVALLLFLASIFPPVLPCLKSLFLSPVLLCQPPMFLLFAFITRFLPILLDQLRISPVLRKRPHPRP